MARVLCISYDIVIVVLFLFLWVLFSSECFCAVTSADIQRKIAIGTGKKRKVPPEERLSVEKVADRFNQVTYLSTEQLSDYFTS